MSAAKYYIYRNLHTGGFSVRYRGRVIAHDDYFIGRNVEFRVSESGRQRVIKEKKKNVHAYSACDKYTFAGSNDYRLVDTLDRVSYNPYVAGHFTCNGKKIVRAQSVLFYRGVCYLLEK